MPSLFDPIQMGDLELPNRILMAPLTRNRADHASAAPHALNAEYYAQRAGAGLIISEATQISPTAKGYAWTPGIHSDGQVEGWRLVTDAVHKAGGRIALQLWHVGRVSHTSLLPGGAAPVAPSAVRADTKTFIENPPGFVDVSEPRALETDEIAGIIEDYAAATRNARAAGFDAVEIHAANGYLIQQFLSDAANRRTDRYGGSIENRARFLLEVVEAVTGAWDAGRVGIRLSPWTGFASCRDSDPPAVFGHVLDQLAPKGLAFLHMVEGETGAGRAADEEIAALRARWPGIYVANNGYDGALAAERVEKGLADAVAFGRPFIANPDLVERLRMGAPLNTPDQATFYGGGAEGYTDYPSLAKAA